MKIPSGPQKTITLIVYMIYRWYSFQTTDKDRAYSSARGAMVLMLVFNVGTLLFLFGSLDAIDSAGFGKGNPLARRLELAAFLFIPIWFLSKFIIKEADVKSARYDANVIKYGKIITIIYIVLSLIFFGIAVRLRKLPIY